MQEHRGDIHVSHCCMQFELAVGKSPYPDFETPFQRIEYIVDKEAPQLTDDVDLDEDCRAFINHWCVCLRQLPGAL